MDCEKFDQHLMDALYEELDEVTRAAMKRHGESCARCSALESGMRATLEVGVLPLEEPSEELEDRILDAAEAAQRGAPWHRKMMHTLSWAGSHAMRPQLAMAALLVLVLGSSILLLRARPGSVGVTPVKVTELGTPDPAAGEASALAAGDGERLGAAEQAADEAAPAAESSAEAEAVASAEAQSDSTNGKRHDDDSQAVEGSSAEDDEQFDRAMANYRAGKHGDAQRDFAEVNRRGGGRAPVAALYEARTVRWQSGCRAAVGHYDGVRSRFPASPSSADAAWEQADCHKLLGEVAQANDIYQKLAGSSSSYQARAVNELASRGQAATAGKSAAAAPKRRAAPKQPAPAAPPQQKQQDAYSEPAAY